MIKSITHSNELLMMNHPSLRYCRTIFFQVLAVGFMVSTSAAEESRFLPLGFPGAVAISDDGRVVAGDADLIPYVWTEAGGKEVIPLAADQELFDVKGISGDGSTVIGGLRVGEPFYRHNESFRWTKTGGVQLLGRLPGDDHRWAYATAASFDGSVIVGIDETNNGRRAYRWTEATGQVDLGTLGTLNPVYPPASFANSITSDGSTIVGGVTTLNDEYEKAFRWSDGTFDLIGAPGWSGSGAGPGSNAKVISGDGNVVSGYYQPGDIREWIWTADDGFTVLPSPGVQTTVAVRAMSHDGSTLVGLHMQWDITPPYNHTTEAAVWWKTDSGYEMYHVADLLRHQKVDLQGWWLTDVYDVSADGRTLIGTGVAPNGVEGSWYAVLNVVPVPEPGSMAMAVVGLLAGVSCVRQHARKRRRPCQSQE